MRRTIALAVALLAASAGCSTPPACGLDYGTCDERNTCGGASTCEPLTWSYGRGDRCARSCEDELDCPRTGGREGRCIDVNGSGAFRCYADCVSDNECPDGWVCQPVRSEGVLSGICLP